MAESADALSRAERRAAWIGLALAGVACTILVLRVLAPFVSVILLAAVAAGLLRPSYRRLAGVMGGHRALAGVLLCSLLIVALLVPVALLARAVSDEAVGLYEMSSNQLTEQSLQELLDERRPQIAAVNRWLEPFGLELTMRDVTDQLAAAGSAAGDFFYRQGVSIAGHLLWFVLGFCAWVLVLYYLLVEGAALRTWFAKTVPLPAAEQDLLTHRFTDMASSLVVGNGLAGVIQGLAGGLVFALAGIPAPVLWGAVMAVLAFIPIVGISLVYLPVAAILLVVGETGRAMAVLLPLLVVATVVEYFLKPVLVGRRAKLPTLLVFLSLIGGLEAFGAVGILLGPLVMTAFLTLASIYQERYRPRFAAEAGGVATPGPVAADGAARPPAAVGAEPLPPAEPEAGLRSASR